MNRHKYGISRMIGYMFMQVSLFILIYTDKSGEVLITPNQIRCLSVIYATLMIIEYLIREIAYRIKVAFNKRQ